VQKADTGKIYAMKTLKKVDMLKKEQARSIADQTLGRLINIIIVSSRQS